MYVVLCVQLRLSYYGKEHYVCNYASHTMEKNTMCATTLPYWEKNIMCETTSLIITAAWKETEDTRGFYTW
jgi:hypothetical protein